MVKHGGNVNEHHYGYGYVSEAYAKLNIITGKFEACEETTPYKKPLISLWMRRNLYNSLVTYDEVPFTGLVRFMFPTPVVTTALPPVLTDMCNDYVGTNSLPVQIRANQGFNNELQKITDAQKKKINERFLRCRLPVP